MNSFKYYRNGTANIPARFWTVYKVNSTDLTMIERMRKSGYLEIQLSPTEKNRCIKTEMCWGDISDYYNQKSLLVAEQ